jgi:tRNA modification GTPase
VSGPETGRAAKSLAGPLPPPRRARRVRFADPATGDVLDDGLLLWFPGPASATGEDVAELHLHGSRAVVAGITAALQGLGLRLAEPGEFTRRAFLAGKLDLTQAEAVADLVAAETEAQRRQALRQLDGELGRLYRGWAGRLARALAHLEAAIDFPDEDLPPAIERAIDREAEDLADEITRHLADGHRGERLRDGIMVAILGPANAGKSSLLNRIARRDAAIVSPLAGTTRDVIEVAIDLGGYPVVLADTAGLRDSADVVEQEGLRRTLARAEDADIRLFVFDARHPVEASRAKAWADGRTILVANKIDLLPGAREDAVDIGGLSQIPHLTLTSPPPAVKRENFAGARSNLPAGAYAASALTGDGIGALLEVLGDAVAESYCDAAPALTRARHRAALEEALAALARSRTATLAELRAEDLRLAWRSLGRITGRVDVEDLLDMIFRDFCIGK